MLTEKDIETIRLICRKNPDFSSIMEKLKEYHRFSISQISHEVRNPVTLISSSLQIIEQQHPEVKTFPFWKETMEDLAFLKILLDELSSFNNGDILHPEPKKLQDWIPNFFASVKNSSACSNLRLEMNPDLPAVAWDFVKIRQVLNNLLRNSLEASSDSSEILFRVSADGPFIEMSVLDHGCGIPSSISPTLFEPFHTTKSNGTGLGLAICKRIVESHHGIIRICSESKKRDYGHCPYSPKSFSFL